MKYFPLIGFSSLALLSLAVTSKGATYTTDFNSLSWGDIDGQDNWSVDTTSYDLLSTAPGVIEDASGIPPYGAQWANIGYATGLSQEDVYVSHTYAGSDSTPLVGSVNASFSSFFTIIDSNSKATLPLAPSTQISDAVRDKFGFRLENTAGDNLFSFILTPTAQVSNPEGVQAFHFMSWSTGVGPEVEVWNGAIHPSVYEGGAFTFNLAFAPGAGTSVDFTAHVGSLYFTGNIPNANTESIKTVGAFWDTSNAAHPGSNFMAFDNLSLVPEASTSLLGLLGASVALMRRRRI